MNIHKNEVHLAGEIARDPDTRFTQTGKKVCTLSVATKNKQSTQYHRVICWEGLADRAEQLTKDEFVKVAGRLQTRSWEDKTGKRNYLTEVVAWQVVSGDEDPVANGHGVDTTDEDIPF